MNATIGFGFFATATWSATTATTLESYIIFSIYQVLHCFFVYFFILLAFLAFILLSTIPITISVQIVARNRKTLHSFLSFPTLIYISFIWTFNFTISTWKFTTITSTFPDSFIISTSEICHRFNHCSAIVA